MEMEMFRIIEDLVEGMDIDDFIDGMGVGFLVCVIVGLAIAFGG
jgi:hypothetical protein